MQFKKKKFSYFFPLSWRDSAITAVVFFCATAFCFLLQKANSSDGFASPIFVLAVLMVSRLTTGYLYGLIAAVLGVICVNYVFTYPYWNVNFTLSGYPLTFLALLAASVMTCALTTQVRQQERLRAENEKEKLRANLLRSVSHDIRTPLTSIIGSTSAVLENPSLPLEKQQELLGDVRQEAQWLIRVVENLLSITRMGDPRNSIIKEPEAVEEILAEVAQKFRRNFPHITTSLSVPNELLLVPMDPILIEQVLFNLMENAVVHGETTTHLQVSVIPLSGFARFTVADNGKGISEHELLNLFDGTLKHNETSSGDGKRNMGLGLSVCRAIVHAHNGSMQAKILSPGLEVSFDLPLL